MNKKKLAFSGFKGELGIKPILGKNLIINLDEKLKDNDQYNCTHTRKRMEKNFFHYCTDCGSQVAN